jgi:hypothetical protein
MYSSTHSLTSALDGGDWSASRPGRFTPRERAPGTQWIGSWPFWTLWLREKFQCKFSVIVILTSLIVHNIKTFKKEMLGHMFIDQVAHNLGLTSYLRTKDVTYF